MEFFDVHMKTPGRIVIFKGRTSRTPVTFENVTKLDVQYLKRYAEKESIKDISVNPHGKTSIKVERKVTKKLSDIDQAKPLVEELEEPKSIIEKLLRESE